MTESAQGASHLGMAAIDGQKRTVMIIEDEKLVAWDIEQTLRDSGYSVFVFATSIREARAALAVGAGHICFAILDIKLEDGNGTVLMDEFATHHIPVLMTTGYSGFVHAQVPVLYKPFSEAALLNAVDSLLHNSRGT